MPESAEIRAPFALSTPPEEWHNHVEALPGEQHERFAREIPLRVPQQPKERHGMVRSVHIEPAPTLDGFHIGPGAHPDRIPTQLGSITTTPGILYRLVVVLVFRGRPCVL